MEVKTKAKIMLATMCFSGLLGFANVYADPPQVTPFIVQEADILGIRHLAQRLCGVYEIGLDTGIPDLEPMTEGKVTEIENVVREARSEGKDSQLLIWAKHWIRLRIR